MNLKKRKKYEKKPKSIKIKSHINDVIVIITGVSGASSLGLTATGVASMVGIPLSVARVIVGFAQFLVYKYIFHMKERTINILKHIKDSKLFYEEKLNTFLDDGVISEKEGQKLKIIYQHYLEKKRKLKKPKNLL